VIQSSHQVQDSTTANCDRVLSCPTSTPLLSFPFLELYSVPWSLSRQVYNIDLLADQTTERPPHVLPTLDLGLLHQEQFLALSAELVGVDASEEPVTVAPTTFRIVSRSRLRLSF
jgi:hypothetical protein